MTQVFDTYGRSIPVTAIATKGNFVASVKDGDKDGYKAVQLGFGETKKLSKPEKGHLGKALKKRALFPAVLKEVPFDDEVKVGQEVTIAEVFRKGSMVDVIGVSKGKGFAGGVKRHGFHGGPKTHGQSDRHRAPGSIGSGTTPGRVMKGLKMAGHMGNVQVTVQGVEVIDVDDKEEIILLKGSIPGSRGNVVLMTKSEKKRKKYIEPVIQKINLGTDEEESKNEALSEAGSATETPAETKPESAEAKPLKDGDNDGAS